MNTLLTLLLMGALPVPKSVAEIEGQLARADARVEAVENVGKACRGSLRLVLRDHAGVIGRLDAVAKEGSPEVKKAVLGSARCFRPAAFAPTFQRLIADQDPAVAAFALEIASNTRDAALAPIVLDAGEKGADACASKPGDREEACVWAAYAPSTLLDSATPELRARAGAFAVEMLEAESPKIREVAVETLAAAKIAAHAPALAKMIEKERSKGFARANEAALVKRFEERLKALKKAG